MSPAEIVTLTIILALLGLFVVTGFLWVMYLRQHRHQMRKPMRHNRNIKILVDKCLSVDVSLTCCQPKVWAEVALTLDGFTVKGDITMFTYFNNQRIIGHITPQDANGQPAGYENLNITVSDPALGEVQRIDEEPDNPLGFQLISPGIADFDWASNPNPRPFTLTIDFDGKVGEEVSPVHIEINGELAQRTATQAGVQLSAATDYAPSGE